MTTDLNLASSAALEIPVPEHQARVYLKTLELCRALCENKLKRDPNARKIRHIKPKLELPSAATGESAKRLPNYNGNIFKHVASGDSVEVLRRNIFQKLLVKWPDGMITEITDYDLESAFSW